MAAEQTLNWQISDQHKMQAGLGMQKYYSIDVDALPNKYDRDKKPNNQGMYYDVAKQHPMQLFDLNYHNISSFVQWQAKWAEKFSTTAGLRFDKHSVYGSSLNPRLGAVYKLNKQHVFKALYGEAFRAPSSEEMLRTYGSIDASGKPSDFHLPNEDLEPEKVKTLSLVWDWQPSKDFNLVTNAYVSETKDVIATKYPSGSVTDYIKNIEIKDYGIKENSGKQTHHGLDLAGQYNLKITADLRADFWASASYIKGETKDEGKTQKIPYVAKYKAKLGATLRYADFLTVTPKIRWTGDVTHTRTKAPTTGIPANCTSQQTGKSLCKTPGYLIADLHLGWHNPLALPVSLWLDIYNVTDKSYYAAAGSGSTTFWDLPQQPRTWTLSLEYKLN